MNDVNFKLGRLKKLNNQKVEIVNFDNGCLSFYISGEDNIGNNYSLRFSTKVLISELDLSNSVDFIKYVDESDIEFGYNGIFDLDVKIDINIMKYLSDKYLLNVSFKSSNYDGDDIVGDIELVFKLD